MDGLRLQKKISGRSSVYDDVVHYLKVCFGCEVRVRSPKCRMTSVLLIFPEVLWLRAKISPDTS